MWCNHDTDLQRHPLRQVPVVFADIFELGMRYLCCCVCRVLTLCCCRRRDLYVQCVQWRKLEQQLKDSSGSANQLGRVMSEMLSMCMRGVLAVMCGVRGWIVLLVLRS